jgi:NAD(P)-dependent dehydrogenase (short-subunit alcohol dehydrogenase family)
MTPCRQPRGCLVAECPARRNGGQTAWRQWGPEGIAVNALAVDPALVLSDPVAAGPVSIAQPAVSEPDAAEALAFLCSPEARKLAGQTLTVDGGLWM